MLSVVLPVHNERASLEFVVDELVAVLGAGPYEIVAVDDGSGDGSRETLVALSRRYPQVRVVGLAGRAGQSAAILAGCAAARGETVVIMDADGQYDPRDVPQLVAALHGNPAAAAVVGYRTRRADGWWRRVQSRVANAVRNWVTGDRVRDTGCGLKVIRREVLAGLPRFDGVHRFLPTLVRREGHVVVEVPVRHRPRRAGRTKYGMWRRAWRGWGDALGVRWLVRRALRYRIDGGG